jgi:hypothetical protein
MGIRAYPNLNFEGLQPSTQSSSSADLKMTTKCIFSAKSDGLAMLYHF